MSGTIDAIGDVRGTTRESLTALRERLGDLVASGVELEGLGPELFGVAGAFDRQPTLRRTLTDPSLDGAARAEFARGLFTGKVGDQALDLLAAAASRPWSRLRDLGDALEQLAVLAEVNIAERASALDDVEDELFRFARLVSGDRELHEAVSATHLPEERRRDLVRSLLSDRANPVTVRLVEQAATDPRGHSFSDALEHYADIAARWKQRLVATVRTAVELDADQRERLARALARQFGHEVHLGIVVDPDVIGGLRVELGDDVIEGTVSARLAEARRRLSG